MNLQHIGNLNETELRSEIRRLEEIVRTGRATLRIAEKLADYRRQLTRIEAVKHRREW